MQQKGSRVETQRLDTCKISSGCIYAYMLNQTDFSEPSYGQIAELRSRLTKLVKEEEQNLFNALSRSSSQIG